MISSEAASIFYGTNTFCFLGGHDWQPILEWLEAIGASNRGNLTKLDIIANPPFHAWQRCDGTRIKVPYARGQVFQRHRHLHLPPDSIEAGAVDMIPPAAERIFEVLGTRKNQPKLTLNLLMSFNLIPGIKLGWNDPDSDDVYFGMDLPNLVERFLADYATEEGESRRVEVLWKGEGRRDDFIQRKDQIEDRGWEILEEKEGECNDGDSVPDDKSKLMLSLRFILRRKKLTGGLPQKAQRHVHGCIQSQPNIVSWRGPTLIN